MADFGGNVGQHPTERHMYIALSLERQRAGCCNAGSTRRIGQQPYTIRVTSLVLMCVDSAIVCPRSPPLNEARPIQFYHSRLSRPAGYVAPSLPKTKLILVLFLRSATSRAETTVFLLSTTAECSVPGTSPAVTR